MVKTYGERAFRPRVRHSSPPHAGSSSLATPVAAAAAPPATTPTIAHGSAAVGSSSAAPASHPPGTAAPAPRRYHTRVGPTPPYPPHPKPSQRAPPYRRAPPSKRAWTSGPIESSSSRPQEPQSPPYQGPVRALPLDLYSASIIRRPLFHCNPIPGNADCSERDLHDEVYYDLPSFSAYPELRDSMLLVQRYSMEPSLHLVGFSTLGWSSSSTTQ